MLPINSPSLTYNEHLAMVIRLKWMVVLPKKVHKVIGLPVLVKAQGKSLLPGLWAEEEEGGAKNPL